MSSTVSTYERDGRTHQIIELRKDQDSKYAFSFGVGKAELILKHIEDIRQFALQHGKGRS